MKVEDWVVSGVVGCGGNGRGRFDSFLFLPASDEAFYTFGIHIF